MDFQAAFACRTLHGKQPVIIGKQMKIELLVMKQIVSQENHPTARAGHW